ncbi:uncharacterized protein LOC115594365 isoform X2 [Sparus aurata]|uniref:uncharacterized protein LOC115594365 isoform X2 n=1 Tax=Sparus aurata TaxID=8175 RepID=UPI0011C1ABC0|nr:uncharacterized protein LOC115594365 isoform X2 [Sparus aurata]
MGFKSTFYHLPSFIFFLFIASSVYISARPISNISVNNLNTSIGCDEGNIGEGNEFNVKGDKGENVSLGEISNIHVSGTNRGCIGGNNNYTVTAQIPAKTEIGNVSNVSVGHNTGSIGSGNRFNIS